MDAQRGPRAGRPATRRLKDISHLYLSTARSATARVDPAWPPAARRALRLVVAGPASAVARAEFAASLALAFARLGRRIAVLDLDPALPNVGFRLALAPADYLSHLARETAPHLIAGLGGVRVLSGVAGRSALGELPIPLRDALRGFDAVLAMLPARGDGLATLRDLGVCVPAPVVDTTLARAAQRSPMIGAWLATAHRPGAGAVAGAAGATESSPPADVVLWIEDQAALAPESRPTLLDGVGVRAVAWHADPALPDAAFWARVPAHAAERVPFAALDPTHPIAKLFDGLAQSLMVSPQRGTDAGAPPSADGGLGARLPHPEMHPDVAAYLEEIRDLPCAPLLTTLVTQLVALDAALVPEVGAFGIRFHAAGGLLCEISVFGELFIARVGQDQAVEYRVRHPAALSEAIDRILHALGPGDPTLS